MANKTETKQISANVDIALADAIVDHGWDTRRKTSAVVIEALKEYAVNHKLVVGEPKEEKPAAKA